MLGIHKVAVHNRTSKYKTAKQGSWCIVNVGVVSQLKVHDLAFTVQIVKNDWSCPVWKLRQKTPFYWILFIKVLFASRLAFFVCELYNLSGVDRWLKMDMNSLLNDSWSPYSQLQIIVESLTMQGAWWVWMKLWCVPFRYDIFLH